MADYSASQIWKNRFNMTLLRYTNVEDSCVDVTGALGLDEEAVVTWLREAVRKSDFIGNGGA